MACFMLFTPRLIGLYQRPHSIKMLIMNRSDRYILDASRFIQCRYGLKCFHSLQYPLYYSVNHCHLTHVV